MSRKIACITLDMEPDHGDSEGRIRLLEDPALLEKYVSIVQNNDVKVTMFVVTSLFERFGSELKALGKRIPVEFAVHSHSHDPYNACSYEEIEKSYQAFKQFAGSAPLGYRAPIGRITKDGLSHLMDFGFRYDSSVYPSVRPGEFGYWNLHWPITPFQIRRENASLVEFPFTALSKIRIVFALSYVKLFGWGAYSMLMRFFPLPDVVVALTHPYDFYFHLVAGGAKGLEKMAFSRNASRAFELFEQMIKFMKKQNYEFQFMSELYDVVKTEPGLPQVGLDEWR